jgi:hypothetical protein
MIESSYHRCAIKLEIQAAPEEVNNCNCSICRRYGATFGTLGPQPFNVFVVSAMNIEYSRTQIRVARRWNRDDSTVNTCKGAVAAKNINAQKVPFTPLATLDSPSLSFDTTH